MLNYWGTSYSLNEKNLNEMRSSTHWLEFSIVFDRFGLLNRPGLNFTQLDADLQDHQFSLIRVAAFRLLLSKVSCILNLLACSCTI